MGDRRTVRRFTPRIGTSFHKHALPRCDAVRARHARSSSQAIGPVITTAAALAALRGRHTPGFRAPPGHLISRPIDVVQPSGSDSCTPDPWSPHAYPFLRPRRRGADRPDRHPVRLGRRRPQPRRPVLHRPARPRRHRPDRRRAVATPKATPRWSRPPRTSATRTACASPAWCAGARRVNDKIRDRPGRSRRARRSSCSTRPSRCRSTRTRTPGEDIRLKYRYLDLRTPGDAAHDAHPHQAGAGAAPLARRARLPGHRDADPDQGHARRRARLPGAGAHAPGRVLRAAAVAAAVQADPDGGRLRPLLPDRALLPRRGAARRPPARIHPARHGVRVGVRARRAGHHRGADPRRVPRSDGRRARRPSSRA